MSKNSSNQPAKTEKEPKFSPEKTARKYSWRMLALLPAWVFVSFVAAQLVLVAGVWILEAVGVDLRPSAAVNTIFVAIAYILMLLFAIGAPLAVKGYQTSHAELGTTRWPSWLDILLSPAGFVVYAILTAVLAFAASSLIPGYEIKQPQEIGFEDLAHRAEYLLAFVALVVAAPLAEEIIFRGYLYGKLKKYVPLWAAMLATSVLFGAVHGQWNVAVDTFALSLVMCSLREVTGSIWSGVLLHMMKNGIAYYFLFINPILLNSIGG